MLSIHSCLTLGSFMEQVFPHPPIFHYSFELFHGLTGPCLDQRYRCLILFCFTIIVLPVNYFITNITYRRQANSWEIDLVV